MFVNNSSSLATSYTQNNLTSPEVDPDAALVITQYVYKVIYVVGIVGNTFTAIVWFRAKLKVSAVRYFIALCIADNLVIITHALETTHTGNVPGLCQVIHILFFAVQIYAIFLVFGLSLERYIEICHPLAGEKLISLHRTKKMILCLVPASLSLSALEGYIWSVDPVQKICIVRNGLTSKFLWIYGFNVLTLFFLVPLLSVIFLNILVMRNLKLSRRRSSAYGRSMDRPARTSFNTSFLVASLYLAISELLYALVHLSYYLTSLDNEHWVKGNPLTHRWRNYEIRSVPLLFADAVALSSYALDLTVFTLSSKTFRKEACGFFPCLKQQNQSVHAADVYLSVTRN